MLPLEEVAHNDRFLASDTVRNGDFAVGRYLAEPELDYEHHDEHDNLDSLTASPEPNDRPYLDFMMNTPAYSWLVANLQKEGNLTRASPNLMEDIRNTILAALPSAYKVSRKAPSQEYKARFELDWDPLSFVREQQYTESVDEALERAITLTGSTNDAQALTTGEYLSQTWPTTGTHVMRLVRDVVRNTTYHHAACEYILFRSTHCDAF